MPNTASTEDRVAIIQALAGRWPPGREFGRTKLVKCTYFLQALYQVPLGYNFSLYSYGPYDSTVLDDLDYAKALGCVEVKTIHYPGGYGYEISRAAQDIEDDRNDFVHTHFNSINWVIKEFGSCSPSEMELLATIVYADRECPQQSIDTLVKQVRQVKPHFTKKQVMKQVSILMGKSQLSAT